MVLGRLSHSHTFECDFGAAIAKQLGLGSYKSAWLLCAKLRRAMVAPGRAPLAGLVEVDETEIPLRTKTDLRSAAAAAARPKAKCSSPAPSKSKTRARTPSPGRDQGLLRRLAAWLRPRQRRPWRDDQNLQLAVLCPRPHVLHEPHVVGAMAAHVVLPLGPPRLLQRQFLAVQLSHALRRQHLQSYLAEFAFRFNRLRTRHAAFRSLLAIASSESR